MLLSSSPKVKYWVFIILFPPIFWFTVNEFLVFRSSFGGRAPGLRIRLLLGKYLLIRVKEMRKQNYLASAERHEIGDRPPGNMSGSLTKKSSFLRQSQWPIEMLFPGPKEVFLIFSDWVGKNTGPLGINQTEITKDLTDTR